MRVVSSLLLAVGALTTVPFLVQYQEATITTGPGKTVGQVLFVSYEQANEDGLPQDERANFRALLQRVRYEYGNLGNRDRALLRRSYRRDYARLQRFGSCCELLFRFEDSSGIRYRACMSPEGDTVRVMEDLDTPDRIFWLSSVPDSKARTRIQTALDPLMARLMEAENDPAKAKKLQAQLKDTVERFRKETDPQDLYPVELLEVNGAWEEFLGRPGKVEERLAQLWPELSPDAVPRFRLLFRLLQALQNDEIKALTSVLGAPVAKDPLFVPSRLDLNSELLPFSGGQETLGARDVTMSGYVSDFLPVPEEVAKRFYPRGKWDPPDPAMDFDARLKRLSHGKGW